MSRFGPYKLYIWDTGTTGTSISCSSLTEISVIEFNGGPHSLHFHTHAHNCFRSAFRKLQTFIQDTCPPSKTPVLVSHNAAFDAGFLKDALQNAEIELPDWLFACSLALARRFIGGNNCTQAGLAERFEVPVLHAHYCFLDVKVLREIVYAIDGVVGRRGVMDVPDWLYASAVELSEAAEDVIWFSGRYGRGEEAERVNDYTRVEDEVDGLGKGLEGLDLEEEEGRLVVTETGRRVHLDEDCWALRGAGEKMFVRSVPVGKMPCGICGDL